MDSKYTVSDSAFHWSTFSSSSSWSTFESSPNSSGSILLSTTLSEMEDDESLNRVRLVLYLQGKSQYPESFASSLSK